MSRALFALAVLAVLLTAPAGAATDPAAFVFRPRPGTSLPLSLALTDERGQAVRLGNFFGAAPVVLVLEYLRCKTLCGITLANVVSVLGALPPDSDFQFVAISIDPRDTPADATAAKAKYLGEYPRAGGAAALHFLTGTAAAVRDIAAAVGFPYEYDAALDQYVHPAGFVIAAPDGRISRYIEGIDAGELQSALTDARRGRTPGLLTRLALLCRAEGAPLGRFTAPILAAFTLADLAATAAVIAVFAAIRRRRHR